MWRRVLAAVVVLAVVVGGLMYARDILLGADEDADHEPVYATAEVARQDLTVSIEGFGNLNPLWSNQITAEAGGYLQSIEVQQGDEVVEGQLIARLTNEDLDREARTGERELREAMRNLAMVLGVGEAEVLSVSPDRGINLVAPISGRLTALYVDENERVQRDAPVARIVDDSVIQVIGEFTVAEMTHVEEDMQVDLRADEFAGTITGVVSDASPVPIPRDDHYVHEVIIEAENPGLLRPGQQVDIVGTGFTVSGAIRGFREESVLWSHAEGTVVDVGVREWQYVQEGDAVARLGGADTSRFIADQQAEIRRLHEELNSVRNKLEGLTVRSPIDGQVAWAIPESGQQLAPGTGIAHVIDNSRMSVMIEVDEIDVIHIEQGMEARATVDAFPGEEFAAQVMRTDMMGHEQDGITRYRVHLEVQDTQRVRPGMTATVSIFVGRSENALVVPIEAVYAEEGRAMVEVMRDGRPQPVAVELGIVSSRYAEILEGLGEGDVVITGRGDDALEDEGIDTDEEEMPPVIRPGAG